MVVEFQSSRHARQVRVVDWQDAEELAAWHMNEQLAVGPAVRTKAGPDGGIDVRSPGWVAQVKHYAIPVGAPDVQRLFGAALGKPSIFYSLGGYTQQAIEYAAAAEVALFAFTIYGDVAAINAIASTFVDDHPRRREELRQHGEYKRQQVIDNRARMDADDARRAAQPRRPGLVAGVQAEVLDDGIVVTWDASVDADSYEVTCRGTGWSQQFTATATWARLPRPQSPSADLAGRFVMSLIIEVRGRNAGVQGPSRPIDVRVPV